MTVGLQKAQPNATGSINKLTLSLLGAFAAFERDLIRSRQQEGIAIAQAKGKRFGAPRKVTIDQENEIRLLASDKNNDKKAIAEKYGIFLPLVYKILKG